MLLLKAGTSVIGGPSPFPWTDNFDGTDAAAWNASKWTLSSTGVTTTPDILSNKGRMLVGASGISRAVALHTAVANIDVSGTVDLPVGGSSTFEVILRGDGGWTAGDATTSVYFQINQGGGYLTSAEYNPGFVGGPSASLNTSAGGTWNWRAQALGATARFNVWQGAEPAWPLTFTTTRLAAGVLQLSSQAISTTVSVNDIVALAP